ncbi:hypothetical protein CRE_07751 [Caenorhabditis remanei]|uniref:Uncharacterized protein n=1 Tax=Caenorhabditis remanei TaxID=31234 RepID=E3N6R7_CAERE|nr:hypothetical protein CRE_07751 [Caenorhabditis remanei]
MPRQRAAAAEDRREWRKIVFWFLYFPGLILLNFFMGRLQIPEKMQFSITLAIQGYLAGHPSVDFISRRTKRKVLMVLLCILAFFTLCNFITIFSSSIPGLGLKSNVDEANQLKL